jgi:hypothetical protein
MSSFSSVRIRQRTGKAYVQISESREELEIYTYCDGHGNTDEQHENGEFNVHCPRLVFELIVQAHCDCASESERNGHTSHTNIERYFPVAEQKAQINFKSDDKQEKCKTNVGNQIQVGHGGIRKDRFLEAWNTTHNGWS